MALKAEVLDALVAAGASAEMIVAAVKADMAEDEARREQKREGNAERQRRFKARKRRGNGSNALPAVTPPIEEIIPPVSSDEETRPPRKLKVGKPDDVTEPTWTDWLALRKSKRAPVTAGVIDGAREEAAKLGWTLEKTLATWVFRGSQGFQAEWITGNKSTGPPGNVSYLDTLLAKQAVTP